MILGGLISGVNPTSEAPTFGRLYTQSDYPDTAYLRYDASISYEVAAGSGIILRNDTIAASPKSAFYAKDSSGSVLFTAGDNASVTIYRRTKNTSDSWTYAIDFASYTSNSYSMDFSTYDYLWYITFAS